MNWISRITRSRLPEDGETTESSLEWNDSTSQEYIDLNKDSNSLCSKQFRFLL